MPPSDPGPQWSPPSPLFASSEWLFDERPRGEVESGRMKWPCKGQNEGIMRGCQGAVSKNRFRLVTSINENATR